VVEAELEADMGEAVDSDEAVVQEVAGAAAEDAIGRVRTG
jgi:hypothetical protein